MPVWPGARTMAKPKATTPKKPRPDAVLIPQPGGRGALMAGGQGQGGRPKEVLRRKCREIYAGRTENEEHGAEFLGRVMRGCETEDMTVTIGSGKDARTEVVKVRPKLRDRLLAAELLADRGYGKPDQALQVEDERPRPTGQETMRRIAELLPQVIGLLPLDKRTLAKILAEGR